MKSDLTQWLQICVETDEKPNLAANDQIKAEAIGCK